MFDFVNWVISTLVTGVKGGRFSKEWAEIQLANYYALGKMDEEDIMRFEEAVFIPESAAITDDETEE